LRIGLEWRDSPYSRGGEVRERIAFGILILLLILLFAFTFAVLGKGEYEPARGVPHQVSWNLA
jgi:hypothetical protein